MPSAPFFESPGALGENDDIGHEVSRGSRQDVIHHVQRSATVVVFLRCGGVRADDDATQRPLGCELEQDLRRDDLRHDPRELIGRSAAEEEVLPLAVGRHVAEQATERRSVDATEVEETVVRVDPAAGLLEPLRTQGLDGVGVAVHVDDAFVVGRETIRFVLHGPHEVPVGVKRRVFWAPHRTHLDHGALQVLHPWPFVVAQAAKGIAALLFGLFHVVRRNADRLLQDAGGEGPVP